MTPEREAQMRDLFETLFPGNPSPHKASAWDGFLACARALEPKWQPIETAPKDGTHILARNDDYGARETYWEFYAEGSQAFRWFKEGKGPSGAWSWSEPKNNWAFSWKPTHWMPLPEQPTTAMSAALEGKNATD